MGNSRVDANKKYRLSLIDDETHRHIRAFKFTKAGLVAIAASAVLLIVGIVYCLIAFTPVRTTIPGYPDARSKQEAVRNAIRIDSLENSIARWELYSENLSRVLSGTQTISLDSIVNGNLTKYLQRISEERIAERDAEMREKVREEEEFAIRKSSRTKVPMEGLHFFLPLKGVLTKGYDPVMHPGVDITAPENTVICATLDGTVIFTGWSDEAGYSLLIQHSDDIISIYKHNQKILKAEGDKLKAGTPIAIAGKYLHFELWHEGVPVNPTDHINLQ